jgi:ubiquinone/menaquinone biosynthesis C-methylase UbiE
MADFLKVNEALNHLDIKKDMMAAEFGCGLAEFAILLAKKMSSGKVYALDIQEEKLSVLKSRLLAEKIHNVTSVLCDLEALRGSTLPDESLDIVLIPNILFQAENKYAIIEEGTRVLKSNGQMLVIDWLAGGPFSPKSGLVSPSEVKEIAERLKLSCKREFSAGDYHFALLFVKH